MGARQKEKSPQVVTFGCRLNTYESEVIKDLARDGGLEDAVVVNTCAVTAEAERQARQAIRRLRRENPDAKLIVTGCSAQISPEVYADMPEVDRVLGNHEKLEAAHFNAATFLSADEARVRVNDAAALKVSAPHLISGFEGRARAFLEVQQGCDHRCTFCIIPFGRGPNRSVPLGQIVDQARQLTANGYREIVLTGVDITSYGPGLPGTPSLGSTVRRLLDAVPEISRLRLSSLDPAAIDDELKRLIVADPRLMPHLHLSLQAGDDMILKRMKRRHSRTQAVALCRDLRARRSDLVIGADLIAGFPTETEEMFGNTLSLIEDCGLTYLHVFPYSPRPGTPAAKMAQVSAPVRKERAARLRSAGEQALRETLGGFVGKTISVLVETQTMGRSEHYAPVRLNRTARPGDLICAQVTGVHEGTALSARILGEEEKAA